VLAANLPGAGVLVVTRLRRDRIEPIVPPLPLPPLLTPVRPLLVGVGGSERD
jgi:hypothetical protein